MKKSLRDLEKFQAPTHKILLLQIPTLILDSMHKLAFKPSKLIQYVSDDLGPSSSSEIYVIDRKNKYFQE